MRKSRKIPLIALDKSMADLAGVALLFMMVMTAISSFSRFLFSVPIPDVEAIAEMLLVGVVFLPFAFTQARREHVVVTLFTDRLSLRIRNRLNWFGWLIGFVAFSILLYAMSKGALKAFNTGDAYLGVNLIVTWPARTLAVIGTAILVLRLAIDLFVPRTNDSELADDEPAEIENTS